MATKHVTYDGIKSTSLPLSDVAGWTNLVSNDGRQQSPWGLYATVAYLHRSVQLRSQTIASVPWSLWRGDTDVTDQPQYSGLVNNMRTRLWMTEAALCIYGAAYWLLERNRIGANVTPRWLLPTSMQPMYDSQYRLSHFMRYYTGETQGRIELDDLAVFWYPNLASEIYPGRSPVEVALASAGALNSMQQFVTSFFDRGLVKTMLISVDKSTSKQEMSSLENYFRRLWTGIKGAMGVQAVKEGVTPMVIGDGLKELENEPLTRIQREDVCAAIGVPFTMVHSAAANYATAQQERLTFILSTVIPECQFIEEIINAQVCKPLGIEFRFDPSQLEEMQVYEAQKSMAYEPLWRDGHIDSNEVRELFDFEPREDEAQDDENSEMTRQFSLLKQATDAGLTIEQAAAMIGFDLPDEPEDDTPEPQEPDENETDDQEPDVPPEFLENMRSLPMDIRRKRMPKVLQEAIKGNKEWKRITR